MNLRAFQQIRRITFLALALALVGYFAYLLTEVYRSRSRLLALAQERILLETEKKATALGYFFAERQEDLVDLTHHRDLHAYYENEALGMSMEYGLGASLEGAQEALRLFRGRKRLGDREIYARVTLLDEGGRPLADTWDPGRTWPSPLGAYPRETRVEVQPSGTDLILSLPFHFKGHPKGTLLAWVPVENIFAQFVGSEANHRIPMALASQDRWAFQQGLAGLEALPPPGTLEVRRLQALDLPKGDGSRQSIHSYRIPIQSSPFSLVAFLPSDPEGQASPRIALALASGIGIIILAGAFGLFRSERHNRVLNAKFRATFDSAGLAIALLDRQGHFQEVNQRFSGLFGHTPAELRQRALLDLAHPEDAASTRTFLEGLGEAPGSQARSEHRFLTREGGEVWGEVFLTALRARAGGPGDMIAVVVDMTEMRMAEQERLLLETQLRQAQRLEAVGQLAAGMAHEINTPIQYIGDNADFIAQSVHSLGHFLTTCDRALEGLELPEALKTNLETCREEEDIDFLLQELPKAAQQIRSGSEKVASIIKALKDFTQSDGGQLLQTNLNQAIQSTAIISAKRWEDSCEVIMDLEAGLPTVTCFPDEMNQVLLALLLNAMDAITQVRKEGEPKGTIRISTRLLEDRVEIRVKDTGAGIPKEIRNRIFDPFFTTKEVGKGVGQGLSIAYHVVVEKHQGSLRFESTLGEGTEFILLLPLKGPASPA